MPDRRGGGLRGQGFLAMPGKRWSATRWTGSSKPFRSVPFSTTHQILVGVTKDSAGVALGACVVQLFRTMNDAFIEEQVSDGSGNFLFYPPDSGPYYIVAYKAGAPDVAGTTVNTLSTTTLT